MKTNIFYIARFIVLSLIVIGMLVIVIYYFSQTLMTDKQSRAVIDEGQYILNKMSGDFEALLKEKEKLLQSEKERLLSDKNETRSYQEKLQIEKKLKEIESQRKQLNKEFEDTIKEKKDIEANLKTIRETSDFTNEQYNELNKKYQEMLTDRENIRKYWQDYTAGIKNIMLEHYKLNLRKKEEIEEGFLKDNGREIVIKEYAGFFSIISDRDKQIKELSKNSSKDLNELKKEVSKLENEIKNMRSNADQSKSSSEYYAKFYREYSQVVSDYNRVIEYFNGANEMLKNKKEAAARDEYRKAVDVFNEIKVSFQNIRGIEKNIQNQRAAELYAKADGSIKNRKYEDAYETLTELISKNPFSDYVDKALSDLLKISNAISDKEKIAIADRYAIQLINNAEVLQNQKKYDEALDICYKLLVEYPYSNYVNKAVDMSLKLNSAKTENSINSYNSKLKAGFEEDYKKYIEYYNKDDYEKARKYYFAALNNSFNFLTNDTINNFKAFEDKYIELIIKKVREER